MLLELGLRQAVAGSVRETAELTFPVDWHPTARIAPPAIQSTFRRQQPRPRTHSLRQRCTNLRTTNMQFLLVPLRCWTSGSSSAYSEQPATPVDRFATRAEHKVNPFRNDRKSFSRLSGGRFKARSGSIEASERWALESICPGRRRTCRCARARGTKRDERATGS